MPIASILERSALVLAVFGAALRWAEGGTGSGMDLFLHLLYWCGLGLWFAARTAGGGGVWRWSGLELGFLAFSIASLVSALRASDLPAAFQQASAFLSLGLLAVLAVQVLGRDGLLSLFLPIAAVAALYAVLQVAWYFPETARAYDPAVHGPMSVELSRRLATNEVFATFGGPNQLAGFLAFILPLVGGMALDGRAAKRGPLALCAGTLGMGLLALFWTGSLGGWVALGAGAAAFLVLARTREKGRALAVRIGLALLAAGVALLVFTPLLSTLAAKSHSLHVRRVYWQAAGRIAGEAPMLGIGLGNFPDRYYRAKSDVQQESNFVHNDYLQLLAETGIVGLLAFLGLLALGLRKALAPTAVEPPPRDSAHGWIAGAGAAGLLFAGLRGFGLPLESGVAAALVWAAAVCFHRPVAGPWTRIGAASGLVALLVHLTVDFDLYQPGVALTLFLGLGLAALLEGRLLEVRLPKAVCAAAAAVLLLVALPLLVLAAPRGLEADEAVRSAERALRGRMSSERISDAVRAAETAARLRPWDSEAHALVSDARFREWHLLSGAPRTDPRPSEELVVQALDNALRLRPGSPGLHDRKAAAHRIFRAWHLRRAASDGPQRGLAAVQALEHLRLALEHAERAAALYPTSARLQYHAARLLDLDGRGSEAVPRYAEALRLSALAGREIENLDRLKLDPVPQARALRRTGRPLEAHDVLVAAFRRRLPDPRELEDEHDAELGPVIDAARDAILKR
jgi:O-antigen ligase/tetratricopeptide (TPR) repeat protein